MIDGRRRALPQLFQPIGEWPCARRIAGRPRANAPPSRRSRRSAALAPPAEAGPFGLRIVLRRGRDAERDAAASGLSQLQLNERREGRASLSGRREIFRTTGRLVAIGSL